MHDPLTPLERRVYHYLLDYLAENTFQPSVRDIGRRFRIPSTKTVAALLQSLADKGFIAREGARSRGVRILGWSSMGHVQPVPLYARVNATEPHLAEAHRERWVAMDRTFLPASNVFLLRQPDDALVGRGILAGDLVLVSPATRARDGDVVAVRVGAHVLVRILGRQGAVLSLLGTTGDTPEQFVGPSDDFTVLGVVTASFRSAFEAGPEDDAAP